MAASWDVLIIGGGRNGLVEHLARRGFGAGVLLICLFEDDRRGKYICKKQISKTPALVVLKQKALIEISITA